MGTASALRIHRSIALSKLKKSRIAANGSGASLWTPNRRCAGRLQVQTERAIGAPPLPTGDGLLGISASLLDDVERRPFPRPCNALALGSSVPAPKAGRFAGRRFCVLPDPDLTPAAEIFSAFNLEAAAGLLPRPAARHISLSPCLPGSICLQVVFQLVSRIPHPVRADRSPASESCSRLVSSRLVSSTHLPTLHPQAPTRYLPISLILDHLDAHRHLRCSKSPPPSLPVLRSAVRDA